MTHFQRMCTDFVNKTAKPITFILQHRHDYGEKAWVGYYVQLLSSLNLNTFQQRTRVWNIKAYDLHRLTTRVELEEAFSIILKWILNKYGWRCGLHSTVSEKSSGGIFWTH
jgi:hypothetical protein